MYRWFKWMFLLCLAIGLGYYRRYISKLPRSRTEGLSNITSVYENTNDAYQFYNRTEQNQNAYFEFKYTIYKNGLCGNLQIPPLKRLCTPFLHVHPHQAESFTILQGQLGYQLDNQVYSCDVHTCSSPIIIPILTPHTFWMHDNKEDLIIIVRIEPAYRHYGLRTEAFENIIGVRRDKYMSLWQVIVFVDSIQTYPTFLPLPLMRTLIKIGSLIGQLLGYQKEYDEYTTLN